ncbi:hypothetical protein DFQ28_010551 [Apophysomyces sp. BC1034]|nr:hypothetical protein DFQ30_001569 [Apophysomyces sp. BC1015]KAG0183531.1 hypothetical protein DFQ29_002586 [Apophysomyces sp. BC1021]KAG0194468.1 hypothetical protein DFQ28_010551 [Apophysomyces sp. BC1034]
MTKPIRIGYVPEHFSTPLYIARDQGMFDERNVSVELVCCPGGTGEMTQKLKDKSLDLAIALTEGLVAGISKGQDWYKIVGTYVDAPLCWAISTGSASKHGSIDTLHKTNVAISRFGSGSHIMAYVLADQQGWLNQGDPFDFTVLHNFEAMRNAVNEESSDFFMWETFTTKPYHDSGEVRRIGQITPPWPAFMFAAHVDILESEELPRTLQAIQKATALFMKQKENESVQHVKRILGYNEQDVRDWFKTVHYASDHTHVSHRALQVAVATLVKAGVIEKPGLLPEALCHLPVAHLTE